MSAWYELIPFKVPDLVGRESCCLIYHYRVVGPIWNTAKIVLCWSFSIILSFDDLDVLTHKNVNDDMTAE